MPLESPANRLCHSAFSLRLEDFLAVAAFNV